MELFKTFFIGGYECADMINRHGNRVDLLRITGHDEHVDEDYEQLANAGIRTVREGIRWSVVEQKAYQYNFSEVIARINAAQKAGIQQLWDICHFGFPDDLSPFHPQFVSRFVSVCRAFTELYRLSTDDMLIVTPINEISFLSYIGGDVGCTVPFLHGSAAAVKERLCEAAIKGIEAIKSIDPEAKIMMVEPLIRIHASAGSPMTRRIREYNEGQFEAMDMITGRLNPHLGGKPEYMDLAGFNYYYNNQWEDNGPKLCWKTEQDRINFPGLLQSAADRYGKPVVLSETGHFKEDRALWMEQITQECITAIANGVNLQGICIYPVLDRPDWDSMEYIPCGIWGYNEKSKQRFLEADYLNTVKACMGQMKNFRGEKKFFLKAPMPVTVSHEVKL